MEFYYKDRNVINEILAVLKSWRSELEGLYNYRPKASKFDEEFYKTFFDETNNNSNNLVKGLDDTISLPKGKNVIDPSERKRSPLAWTIYLMKLLRITIQTNYFCLFLINSLNLDLLPQFGTRLL